MRPRGAAVSTTERPRGEPSCPNARSQRVTTHGAAPPRLPKPTFEARGLCARILACFSSFPSLPDLLTVRGVVKAQGHCAVCGRSLPVGSRAAPATPASAPCLVLTSEEGAVLIQFLS